MSAARPFPFSPRSTLFFLGFCLVTLWNDFGTARTAVANEASAVLAANAFSMQLGHSGPFRQILTAYAHSVVEEEWPDMDAKLTMNGHTHQLVLDVWRAYLTLAPTDKHDNILYANLGNVLLEAARQRNARALLLSGNIYTPVWVVIVFGFFGSVLALLCANPDQEGWQLVMEFVVVFTVLSCIYLSTISAHRFPGCCMWRPMPLPTPCPACRSIRP